MNISNVLLQQWVKSEASSYHLLGSWPSRTCSTPPALWRRPWLWTGRLCWRWVQSRLWWSCSHHLCPPTGEGSPGPQAGTPRCIWWSLHWSFQAEATSPGPLTRTGVEPGRFVETMDLRPTDNDDDDGNDDKTLKNIREHIKKHNCKSQGTFNGHFTFRESWWPHWT